MTLLIGIKCTDGLVIAADGATTFGDSLGNRTIRQPSRKLTIIDNRMIVAVTGPVGLQQRFVGELSALQPGPNMKRHQMMELLANAIRKPLQNEYKNAEAVRGALGNAAIQGVLSGTIIGLAVESQPTLIQFDHQGSPECATDTLRFISLGSGQPLADPFLAFLARVFWQDHAPTLNEGIFAATWTLQHAIKTNPGGVDDPIQVMTLTPAKGSAPDIRELAPTDLQEHRQAIMAAESRLATFRDAMKPAEHQTAIPTPEGRSA